MSDPNAKGPVPPLRIFDRERAGHAWASAFEELRHPDLDRRWIVAANWRMDHRVSPEREAGDLEAGKHFGSIGSADDWWEARATYFREEMCHPFQAGTSGKISAYGRSTNAANLVPARVSGFDKLVHVGSLSGLLWRASRSTAAADIEVWLRRRTGRGLPGRVLGSSSNSFDGQVSALARALLVQGPDVIRQAAGLLVDSLGETEPPWWACFAHEVHEALDSGSATDLCTALGLGHRMDGEWLVVWTYPVHEAGPLYRPTVLEANDSPYHFPSPPDYPLGVTMPLNAIFHACREVVHPPLRGAAAVANCTGDLLYLEDFAISRDNGSLAALRAEHRARLHRGLSVPSLTDWLGRHPEIKP
jgi:hypothetical protein